MVISSNLCKKNFIRCSFIGSNYLPSERSDNPYEVKKLPEWGYSRCREFVKILMPTHNKTRRGRLRQKKTPCRLGKQININYTWHVTWHEMWQVGGRWTFSQNVRSLALTVWVLWIWQIGRKRISSSVNQWINESVIKVFVEQPRLQRGC